MLGWRFYFRTDVSKCYATLWEERDRVLNGEMDGWIVVMQSLWSSSWEMKIDIGKNELPRTG